MSLEIELELLEKAYYKDETKSYIEYEFENEFMIIAGKLIKDYNIPTHDDCIELGGRCNVELCFITFYMDKGGGREDNWICIYLNKST